MMKAARSFSREMGGVSIVYTKVHMYIQIISEIFQI